MPSKEMIKRFFGGEYRVMKISAALNHVTKMQQEEHMRTGVILVFTFIKRALKIKKVKSAASASTKIKTIHHRALYASHPLLSHP